MLSEINQTEKGKNCMILRICGVEKIQKKLMNTTKKKQTHRCNVQTVVTSGERETERDHNG